MKSGFSLWSAFFAGMMVTAVANAGGTTSGGGDLCEDRIQAIRDDIKLWITSGGASALKLPVGITPDEYSKQMLESIGSAKIKCVKAGDSGYPVTVDGTPKVCRFDRSLWKKQITCDYAGVLNNAITSESDQYVLIHHEYAGFSGLESPKGDVSTYQISNQISGFLIDQVVRRLAVGSNNPNNITGEQLTPYKKNLLRILTLSVNGEFLRFFKLRCELVAGGLGWSENETEEQGMERQANTMIEVATSGAFDLTGPQPIFKLTGPFAHGSTDHGGYAFYKDVKEEVTVTMTPDYQDVVSLQWIEYQKDGEQFSGDIAHPVVSAGGWSPSTVVRCK